MRKFIILENFSKEYINIKNKVKKNKQLIDNIKFFSVLILLITLIGTYGYLVNMSSTKGYFLRQEMQKLENVKFNNSITQLEILKMEKKVWDEIDTNRQFNEKKITINERTIYLTINNNNLDELAKK